MDTNQILTDLRAHRDRLDKAIAALELLGGGNDLPTPLGRPGPRTLTPASTVASAAPAAQGKRRISPEGMARIVAATKARWARVRAATKAPGAGRRVLSAAARKAMSEASKRRWAAHTKGAAVAAKAAPAAGRTLSAAARKRLSELARARWARQKKQGKNRL